MHEYTKEAIAAAAGQNAELRQAYETERAHITRIQDATGMKPSDKWDALYEAAQKYMHTLAAIVGCHDPNSAELFL